MQAVTVQEIVGVLWIACLWLGHIVRELDGGICFLHTKNIAGIHAEAAAPCHVARGCRPGVRSKYLVPVLPSFWRSQQRCRLGLQCQEERHQTLQMVLLLMLVQLKNAVSCFLVLVAGQKQDLFLCLL